MQSMVEGAWAPKNHECWNEFYADAGVLTQPPPARRRSPPPPQAGRSRHPDPLERSRDRLGTGAYSAASFTFAAVGSASLPVQGCSAMSNNTPSGPYIFTSNPPTRSGSLWSM